MQRQAAATAHYERRAFVSNNNAAVEIPHERQQRQKFTSDLLKEYTKVSHSRYHRPAVE